MWRTRVPSGLFQVVGSRSFPPIVGPLSPGTARLVPERDDFRLARKLWGTYTPAYTGENCMAQVTLYLDPETEAKMKLAAKAAGVSQSRWVAELIRERTASCWPESFVKLVGTWSDEDFPSLEEIRTGMGEDVTREAF
jgi:hypothetical protein